MKIIGSIGAAAFAAISLQVGASAVSAADVWSDALLHIRGAVDRNNDGLWTATDYTSDNTEIPDVAHAAETAPSSLKIKYGLATHADSNVRIVNQEVKLISEGRTVTRPVLYFPQGDFVEGGVNKAHQQYFYLFDGGSPITNDQWTAIFRLKPDGMNIYKTDGKGNPDPIGGCWFFNFPVQGARNEMRLGLRTETGNKASGFINLCVGNTTNNKKTNLLATNDWMEVSIAVSGRVVRLSSCIPGVMRRWNTHTVGQGSDDPSGILKPSLLRLGMCGRGAVESTDYGNADSYRGCFDTIGIWNRALSDAEVVEAFGGGNPGIVRLGVEGGSAKLFAGEKATGPVTLNPTEHDQRLWPASFGAGAVVTVPFSVDKYRAGKAQALRIVAQPGSAKGNFLVSIDGKSVGEIPVAACAANEVPSASLLALKEKYFALGDHTLTLTCDMADGDVKLDVVEIAGSWQAGDGTANDTSYDSDTGWAVDSTSKPWADTYYAASMNMKDCAYYIGGSLSALRRDKVIRWNLPKGLASRAKFRLTFRILGGNGAQKPGGGNYSPSGRNILTTINGTLVSTQLFGNKTYDAIEIPADVLHDGLNEVRLGFDTLDVGYIWCNLYYLKLDMTSCESDWRPGMAILLR